MINAIFEKLGVHIPMDAKILDFGCGAGCMVYSLLDQGYTNVYGYDVKDYLKLRDPADLSRFHISSHLDIKLPYDDNTFDLILSTAVFEHVMDQVAVFRELHRITRPGGHALHQIPARYYPIEGHIYVPFGTMLVHRWWFKFWALMGIRNEFQHGLSASETADRNAWYAIEALNYVPTSCYKVVWKRLGFDYKFVEQQFFDSSIHPRRRLIGKINRSIPIFAWVYRTFLTRVVYLKKLEVRVI
jgi:SAM-dependent methyltransferase